MKTLFHAGSRHRLEFVFFSLNDLADSYSHYVMQLKHSGTTAVRHSHHHRRRRRHLSQSYTSHGVISFRTLGRFQLFLLCLFYRIGTHNEFNHYFAFLFWNERRIYVNFPRNEYLLRAVPCVCASFSLHIVDGWDKWNFGLDLSWVNCNTCIRSAHLIHSCTAIACERQLDWNFVFINNFFFVFSVCLYEQTQRHQHKGTHMQSNFPFYRFCLLRQVEKITTKIRGIKCWFGFNRWAHQWQYVPLRLCDLINKEKTSHSNAIVNLVNFDRKSAQIFGACVLFLLLLLDVDVIRTFHGNRYRSHSSRRTIYLIGWRN